MYLWLKPGVEEKLEELKKQGLVGKDLCVETNRSSGKKFINTAASMGDPTQEIAGALVELTEKVTARDCIYRGFRPEGIYSYDGAVLVVTTGSNRSAGGFYQEVRISGPSVEAVNIIYSIFRQGKLPITESWEENSIDPSVPPTSAPKSDVPPGSESDKN